MNVQVVSICKTALLVTAVLLCTSPTLINGEEETDYDYDYECSRYLAPSSIPNAGFGVFTTRDIKNDEPLLHMSDAPSIPITDIVLHTENEDQDFWSHVDYNWGGSGLAEYEADSVAENVFNLGCLSNFHTYLKNIKVSKYRMRRNLFCTCIFVV